MSTAAPRLFSGDLDEETLQLYLASPRLAVDTETRGLNTQRDRLCLVQMCDESGVVSLVQVGDMQDKGQSRLKQLLESPRVEKVFHYARFDLAALRHWLGIQVQPVWCTRTASRLIRTYTDRHGLKDLARELLGIDMDKEQQSSDWASATLSDKQLAYAASDVIHLLAIQSQLDEMLRREGRWELARACIDFLPTRVTLDLAGWEGEDIFAHV